MTIPVIWVAIALSLLVHLAALRFWLPRMHDMSAANADAGKSRGALAVRLDPMPISLTSAPPALPSSPPVLARPSPRHRAPPVRTAAKRNSTPPVIALDPQRPPEAAPPTTPPIAEPASPVGDAPLERDLTSYIEARRRARGESGSTAGQANAATTPSAEDDIERRNRIVAANLGLNRTPTFGYDPKSAGGIFQIEHIGYDDAEFYFFGLDKYIGRNAKQLIEVRKGAEKDIRIAVVHKMIAIIRDNVSGDFVWLSRRGPITMSARPSDDSELEEFVMRDVFPDARLPLGR